MNTSFENRLFNNCGLPAVLGLFPTAIVDTNGKTLKSGIECRLEINNLPRQLNRATLTLALYGSEESNGNEMFQGSTCRVSNRTAVLTFKFKQGPIYTNLSVTTQAGEELARIDALTVDSVRSEMVYNEIRVDYLNNDISFTPYEEPQPESQTSHELAQELNNLEELSLVLSQRIRTLSFAMQSPPAGPSAPALGKNIGYSVGFQLDQSALEVRDLISFFGRGQKERKKRKGEERLRGGTLGVN
eukprot:Phypoly_transcript_13503.p1 GENE.Phypoly_transcript_13503~~Phypoly_transcript_13503.p1  ORF type:complete len:244 (+),score=35.95 Phypoly_transcript_13503:141-872(+)